MTKDEARHLVARAVSAVTEHEVPAEALTAPATIRDLGVSSLMLFEFVSALEDLGGIVFDDNDVDSANFGSVDAVVSLLGKYQPNGATGHAHGDPPNPSNAASGSVA